MNISTFTLGALLAGTMSLQAQAATTYTLHLADTVKKGKTPAAQITEKHHKSQVHKETEKSQDKKHKERYCPTCGRG